MEPGPEAQLGIGTGALFTYKRKELYPSVINDMEWEGNRGPQYTEKRRETYSDTNKLPGWDVFPDMRRYATKVKSSMPDA